MATTGSGGETLPPKISWKRRYLLAKERIKALKHVERELGWLLCREGVHHCLNYEDEPVECTYCGEPASVLDAPNDVLRRQIRGTRDYLALRSAYNDMKQTFGADTSCASLECPWCHHHLFVDGLGEVSRDQTDFEPRKRPRLY